ncbi:GMC family oxidoreductase [Paenibacillus alkalitolerans]|uniref:GMC family oxidoreductase n=1 Tax=Paenibacillus alkalitolerans TaxID=2799335 RepID=UPI001F206EE6|nr:GMC family oxidoreductase [Paenibacillus alkalitolerans]
MYVYVTEHGDTLRNIANRYDYEVSNLLSLNPHIAGSDFRLSADIQVKLPSPLPQARKLGEDPVQCPPPPAIPPLFHWIPLTPVEIMAQTDYDVLIVGSGAGGAAVLWRLCQQWAQSGKRIGMVEAGDLLLPTHAFHIPTFNEPQALEYWRQVAVHKKEEWPDFQGAKIVYGLGGRTLIWYGWSPRFEPPAFRTWPITYKELLPYYTIAEQIMNVTTQYTQGSSLQEILLHRLLAGGYPEATSVPLSTDLQQTQFGQVHSNVYFSSIDFLAYALNTRHFDLAVNTPAVQILTEKGRAAGVKVVTADKRSYEISAKTVVVCGSTWETPRLLLNSGIPGEAIGKYLQFHPVYEGYGTVDRADFPEILGVAAIYVPDIDERNYQLQIFSDYYYHFIEKPLRAKERTEVHCYGVVEPRASNYVYLDPVRRDAYGVPLLNVEFSFSEKDMALLREMHAQALAFTAAAGMELDIPFVLRPPGTDNHESGTCRMGDDPATSATNRYGQIHGVPGLFVADNSVLNLTSPANPTLTTIALAIRTADYISVAEQSK